MMDLQPLIITSHGFKEKNEVITEDLPKFFLPIEDDLKVYA